jgi:outer membrane protein TolC
VQLNRESELLRSRQALLEAQGRLMTALDIRYAVSPEPLELRPQWSTPDVVRREAGPQDDAQMQSALSSWAPLQLAEFKRRQAELRLRFAANQMEPMVDLVVSYSTTGLANRRGLATDLTGSTKYPDWFVGLSMELPAYGNQKSQAQYLAQAGRRDQAELEIAALRLSFANDINARWQDLVNAVAVLENGAVDFALREQIESVEKERYRLGMGSLNAVIQKESEVIEARLRTLDNQVRFEVALATWRYLKGELMADAGITIN